MPKESQQASNRKAPAQTKRGDTLSAYLLLLPSAILMGIFGILPLVNAALLSLREWRLAPGPWVGLANYQRALFHEGEFWQSLAVTGWYVAGTVPLTLGVAYLLAELLHARIRGLAFYRTLFFTPYIVSPVAAAAVWSWILNPNFGIASALAGRWGWEPRWLQDERGVFSLLAGAAHLSLPAWLSGPSVALVCIIAVTVWQSLGFAVVVLLAGLSAVPTEVVEAARLDGARGWQLLRRVKLPLLSPTLFFLLIVFTIRAFQMFTQVYVLSPDHAGGPAGTTRNVTVYLYQTFNEASARLGPGYGSAVAMLLFLMILALTAVQFRVLGRKVHYG